MALLQQFGVILGHRRVVVYVEPESKGQQRLTTNTARTHLLLDNTALPWAEWASEFRNKMPAEIEELINEVAAGSSASDHSKSIRERLKTILDLYRVSRYRPTPAGKFEIDAENTTRGGVPKRNDDINIPTGSARAGRKGGAAGGIYSVFLKKDGDPGEEVQPDIFPEVRWVSVTDRTREPGDMEDRAGRYLVDQNLLLINADFRVFTDMVQRWCRELEGNPAVSEIVADAVHGWFEQTLVETVLGVQALQNSREWSVGDVAKAISEEALTAAVLPRYHVNFAVKRELGSKLGKLQTAQFLMHQ